MGNDMQRVQQLGDSIRQLREDMDALSKIAPQVEKMVALAGTLESTTKNINENIAKVNKTVSDVEDKSKKVKELMDTVGQKVSYHFDKQQLELNKRTVKYLQA